MTGERADLVCIVDDDASVWRSLQRLLKARGFQVQMFANAEQYLDHQPPLECACLILDVRMPGIDGLELQGRLEIVDHPTSIVFLTGHGDIPMSVKAIKSGAVDFLTKPVDVAVLLEAVERAISDHTQRKAELQAMVAIRQRLHELTPREMDVLRLVVQGLKNKQIADRLGIAEKTVKIHRSRVMGKMAAGSFAELVAMAQQIDV